MMIYYPTYYLVPVAPLIPLDEVDYNFRYNEDYSIDYNEDYDSHYTDEYSARCNVEGNEVYNSYRNINEDIFYEVDDEYVNETLK